MMDEQDFIMMAASNYGDDMGKKEEGIVMGHAFSLMGVHEVNY